MTGNIIASPFSIKNGRLYIGGDEHSRREVTHVRVQKADGVKYLKLSVSGKRVSARWAAGDRNPFFTVTVRPEGYLEGVRPGGYQFVWITSKKGRYPGRPLNLPDLDDKDRKSKLLM